jgi:rubrerythrin
MSSMPVFSNPSEPAQAEEARAQEAEKIYICDRCGDRMREKSCKVTCPNCGNRFDCSDLNIYFD